MCPVCPTKGREAAETLEQSRQALRGSRPEEQVVGQVQELGTGPRVTLLPSPAPCGTK